MVGYVVAGGLMLASLYIARKNKHATQERERLAREKQEREKEQLKGVLSAVAGFNDDFQQFLGRRNYLAHYDIHTFTQRYASLYRDLKSRSYKHLNDFQDEIRLLDTFCSDYPDIPERAKTRNERFVAGELRACRELFDDVEGRVLDIQQRNAILTDQDNNLVIAGAGCGKTTTIAGKVKYLTQRLEIVPADILLISFTRKSADEMTKRIREKMELALPVKTFHKLGLDIIGEAQGEKPNVFDLSQKQQLQLLQSFISNTKADSAYFGKLMDFLAYFLKPYKDIHSFKSDAEHNNYLREQKLEGYKIVEKVTADGSTIRYRERFKSQEEVLIGNFLFRNNIPYEYEEKYQYKTASKKFGQYKPDFYLPDHNIYIEHFGVNEKGEVPLWFRGGGERTAQERYTDGMQWKRNEHQFNGTSLIETFSWEQQKGVLLENLTVKLQEKGVALNPMSNEELWGYLEENASEDIDAFTQLLNTFLALFKSNNEKVAILAAKAEREKNTRAGLFLQLFEPVYLCYESYLAQLGEIDFSDMINSAAELVGKGSFVSPYRYIIIDEFQDISLSRFQLIKALLDQRPGTRLLCVGDDWQSIYRFAGSDIGVFTGFSKYFKSSPLEGFERQTHTSYIEHTYRFDNKLIGLSENFILKNPNQLRKSLKSNKVSDAVPYTIHRYDDERRNGAESYDALCGALQQIIDKEPGGATILLLGRYNKDSKVFGDSGDFSSTYDTETELYNYYYRGRKGHQINFMTVHSSKGLEADYVVILNCNSGTYGFPSEISDDPLLNFVLSEADHFPNGEERRLFYVALTRARKHVHMLAGLTSPSKFVSEIESNEHVTSLKCEWCDNGYLIERTGPFGDFYACNNNHYCNFTRNIAPKELYEQGLKCFHEKEFDEAIRYIEKALKGDPINTEALYYLGRCHTEKKEHLRASENYMRAIQAGYDRPEAYYWRGHAGLGLQQYGEAIEDFLKFRERRGDTQAVNYFLSFAYYKSNKVIKALDHIAKELEVNPKNVHAQKLSDGYIPALQKRFTEKPVKIVSHDTHTVRRYLELAIEFEINIRFDYHKSPQFDGGERSLRTIKPRGFKQVGQSLCVAGYCHMRKEDRTFALERMANLVLNPGRIEYRDGPGAE